MKTLGDYTKLVEPTIAAVEALRKMRDSNDELLSTVSGLKRKWQQLVSREPDLTDVC